MIGRRGGVRLGGRRIDSVVRRSSVESQGLQVEIAFQLSPRVIIQSPSAAQVEHGSSLSFEHCSTDLTVFEHFLAWCAERPIGRLIKVAGSIRVLRAQAFDQRPVVWPLR